MRYFPLRDKDNHLTPTKVMIEVGEYKVAEPDGIETPAMLVFADQLDHNIKLVGELVGGSEHLFVHVKTHKSIDVARKQLASGVAGFKCATLKELEMALDAGAPEAILSYPLVQKSKVLRFAALAQREATVSAIASAPAHVKVLGAMAQERQQTLRVMIDLNVGMFRTGVPLVRGRRPLPPSRSTPPPVPGRAALVRRARAHLRARGAPSSGRAAHPRCPTPESGPRRRGLGRAPGRRGRLLFLFILRPRRGMYGSPGTCVYWDAGYGSRMADLPFKWAALVLTQVVDCYPEQQTITTDLGTKAISDDGPMPSRAKLLQNAAAELLRQNEEHGVFSYPDPQPAIGTYLLAVPGHVCPTTIRYPGAHVIDGHGQVASYYLHSARDRS